MTDLSFIDAKNKMVEDVKGDLEGEEEGRGGSVQELLIVLKFMEGILYIFFSLRNILIKYTTEKTVGFSVEEPLKLFRYNIFTQPRSCNYPQRMLLGSLYFCSFYSFGLNNVLYNFSSAFFMDSV